MRPNILTIAASDPSGGAGIEADIKVMSAHGINALTAITAVTVQDTKGVHDLHPTDVSKFRSTLGLLRHDQPIDAIKIGALCTGAHLEAVNKFLAKLAPLPPVVLDPILKSTSGSVLFRDNAAQMIADYMLDKITMITPNTEEASSLTRLPVSNLQAMTNAAMKLCQMGAKTALVKGGHLKGESHDLLCMDGKCVKWANEKIPHEFHGTGCALSSAIASNLAKGTDIPQSITNARDYLIKCMKQARKGRGDAYILEFWPTSPKSSG